MANQQSYEEIYLLVKGIENIRISHKFLDCAKTFFLEIIDHSVKWVNDSIETSHYLEEEKGWKSWQFRNVKIKLKSISAITFLLSIAIYI